MFGAGRRGRRQQHDQLRILFGIMAEAAGQDRIDSAAIMVLQGAHQIDQTQAPRQQLFDQPFEAGVMGQQRRQRARDRHQARRRLAASELGHGGRDRQFLLWPGQPAERFRLAQQGRIVATLQGPDGVDHADMGAGGDQQGDGPLANDLRAIGEQHGHQFGDHRQRRHGVAQLLQRGGPLVVGAGGDQFFDRHADVGRQAGNYGGQTGGLDRC